jgi:transcription-repair coupling factor (superfamily II helicase)
MSEDESRQVPLDALPALLPRLNHVTALPPGAAAWVVAERARIALDANELPLVVVAATRDDADRIASELRFHLHDDGTGDADIAVRVLPADDTRTWDGLSPHPELPRQRLAALRAIDEGEPVVVVVPARALLARVLSPESIDELTVSQTSSTTGTSTLLWPKNRARSPCGAAWWTSGRPAARTRSASSSSTTKSRAWRR